jgi:TPR repeat protein
MMEKRWKTPALNEINLGDITDQDQGESRDDATAAKIYLRDAERGEASAQFFLAMMLADGTGIAKDPVAAFMWAELALYRGNPDLREGALKLQTHLESALTPAQIEQAREAARRWHPETG